jgi:hypothetical protein
MQKTLAILALAMIGCRTAENDDAAVLLLREFPGSNEARAKVVASMLRDLDPGALRKVLARRTGDRDSRVLALGSPGWEAAYQGLLREGDRVEADLWDALFDADSAPVAMRLAELLVLIDSPERPPVALLDVLLDTGAIPAFVARPARIFPVEDVASSLRVPPLREETTPLQVLREIEEAEPFQGPFFEQRRDPDR